MSIGLPVYNGERFIREALDSILAQTFADFEVIISDNASTDRTEEICRSYAARDERVRYFRNAENLGAARNFNRVFELSRGAYFKWAAHDDLLASEYLRRCTRALDTNVSAVLCFCNVRYIDQYGNHIGVYDIAADTTNLSPHARFREAINLPRPCFGNIVFGLVRASALSNTRLFGAHFLWDHVLVPEMSLVGEFVKIPEPLYWNRRHKEQSCAARDWRQRAIWMDPLYRGGLFRTRLGVAWERLSAIQRSDLGWREKGLCYLHMVGFVRTVLRRLLLSAVWKVWSRAKREMMAASRSTYLPLRLWALARFLRSSGWLKLSEGLCAVRSMPDAELLLAMARAVTAGNDPSARRMLVGWRRNPTDPRRKAAALALAEQVRTAGLSTLSQKTP